MAHLAPSDLPTNCYSFFKSLTLLMWYLAPLALLYQPLSVIPAHKFFSSSFIATGENLSIIYRY